MKDIWMRADIPDDAGIRKKMIITGLESGIGTFIIRPEDRHLSSLGKMKLAIIENGILSGDAEGRFIRISSPKDQKEAMDLCGKIDTMVVSADDWSVIPMENLIAASSGTRILACVSSSEELELCRGILEKGTDGAVLDTDDPEKISGMIKNVATSENIILTAVKVTGIKSIQTGDRVCVDMCSSMVPGEGMLVGSQSSCLFLIQSESEENGYVATRPFRVNAGAVHAYAMIPGGKTRYLSELRAGDDVTIVSGDGSTRTASIGRCKTEVRPMVMLAAEYGGKEYTTVLQNAETVKLITPGGSVSVSRLKEGDTVMAHLEDGGRHFGMPVEERIREI